MSFELGGAVALWIHEGLAVNQCFVDPTFIPLERPSLPFLVVDGRAHTVTGPYHIKDSTCVVFDVLVPKHGCLTSFGPWAGS